MTYLCEGLGCWEDAVPGSEYCADHRMDESMIWELEWPDPDHVHDLMTDRRMGL